MSSSQPEEPKLGTTEVGRTLADSMEGGGSSMATELATNDQLSVINISSSSTSSTTTTTTASSLSVSSKQQCDSVIDSANDVTLATMTSTETLNSGDINNNKLTMVAPAVTVDDNNSDIVEGISSISISKFVDDEVPPTIITNELSTSASSSSSSILSSTSTLKDTGEHEHEDDQQVVQPPVRKFILEPMMKSKDDEEEEEVSPTAIQSKASNVAPMVAPLSSPSSDSESSQHSSSSAAAGSQEYHLKWIKWKGNKVPIVTQNSNGPCPLLAIINVLLLRKNICFPPMIEIITASQLMEYLCDHMLNNVPKNLSESARLNYEQNFQDALSVLPRLPTGLDVNVRFTGFSDFEYTPECIIFDLLRISLYHGWLVDPSDREIFRIVNTLSYNQLVDRIITSKGNSTSSTDMFIAEEFLNQTASQLTNYGLLQLIKLVKEDELCILFRNNHFITLYKYKSKLFQLVTDQGFLTESNVVWETLTNIEGDSRFMDGDFVLVPPKPVITTAVPAVTAASSASIPFTNTQQQIDQDYLIALSLEQEQKLTANQQPVTNPANSSLVEYRAPSVGNHLSSTTNRSTASATAPNIQLSDEELARKLQQEEDQRSYELMQQQQQQQNRSNAIPASSPNYKSFPSGRTPVQPQIGVSHPKSSHSSSTSTTSSSSHHQFQQQQQDLHSRNSRHSNRNRTTSLGSGSSTTTTNQQTGASGGAGSGRSSTGSNHRNHHQQSHHSASSNSDNNPNNDRDSVSSRESKSKNCTIS